MHHHTVNDTALTEYKVPAYSGGIADTVLTPTANSKLRPGTEIIRTDPTVPLDAFSELEMCYNAFSGRGPPRHHWGNLQSSPNSLAAFRGGRRRANGKGMRKRSGRGRNEKGWEKRGNAVLKLSLKYTGPSLTKMNVTPYAILTVVVSLPSAHYKQ